LEEIEEMVGEDDRCRRNLIPKGEQRDQPGGRGDKGTSAASQLRSTSSA
jgi:hypothetical protein